MEVFLAQLNSLGLPGWTLVTVVLIVVLHYTGVFRGLGAFLSNVVSSNQRTLADLQSKALDQNGMLISFVTDKLANEIEELEEGDKLVADRLTRIETKISLIVYELTEREREARLNRDDQNFRLISDLQDRLASLEARRISNEPTKQNDNPDI